MNLVHVGVEPWEPRAQLRVVDVLTGVASLPVL